MPQDAAAVVNNFLSPGLRGRQDWIGTGYRGLAAANNWFNLFMLGWSGFHLTLTAGNAIAFQFNQAVQELQAGKPVKAMASLAKFALAPATIAENWIIGSKLMREWNLPGSTNPAIARLVDAIVQAGGRVGLAVNSTRRSSSR